MDIVYGLHPVRLALSAQRRVLHKIFLKKNASSSALEEINNMATQLHLPVKTVSSNALRSMTNGAVHQGVCLKAGRLNYAPWSENTLSNFTNSSQTKLCVVLNGIHDPMNYGAILRSCYFFGVDHAFSSASSSCGLTAVVSKASAGVMEIMQLTRVTDLMQFLTNCKDHRITVIGTISNENTAIDVASYVLTKPSVLIIGNEGVGITKEVLAACDDLITLPPGGNIASGVDSLNVSVATGVILHSLLCKTK